MSCSLCSYEFAHFIRVNILTNRKLGVKGFPSQSHMLTIPTQKRTRQAGNSEQEMHMRYGSRCRSLKDLDVRSTSTKYPPAEWDFRSHHSALLGGEGLFITRRYYLFSAKQLHTHMAVDQECQPQHTPTYIHSLRLGPRPTTKKK